MKDHSIYLTEAGREFLRVDRELAALLTRNDQQISALNAEVERLSAAIERLKTQLASITNPTEAP